MPGKKQWIAAGLIALLLCACCLPALSEEYRELKQGMEGDDVQRFKKAMYWLGYFTTEKLDGNYTKTTAERVKQLQKTTAWNRRASPTRPCRSLSFPAMP
jgi:dipeptidase